MAIELLFNYFYYLQRDLSSFTAVTVSIQPSAEPAVVVMSLVECHSKTFIVLTDYFKHISLERIDHFYSTSNVPSVYSNTANAYSTTAHALYHLLSRHGSFFSNRLNQLSCYKIAV